MSAEEPTIHVCFPTRRYVLTSSRAEGSSLSLFAPTQMRLLVGTRVRLEVSFGDCDERFQLRGQVAFQRSHGWGITPEVGVGVAFEGDNKKVASQMLAFCAGKPLTQGTATRERKPTNFGCVVTATPRAFKGKVLDISAGGAFVAAPQANQIRVGSDLRIKLDPGWFGIGGKQVEVRVMWRGSKQGMLGFGARFLGDQLKLVRELRKYLGEPSA